MQLTMLSQKSVLGNGVPSVTPRLRASRKPIAIRNNAAQAATALNTKRSEEVGFTDRYVSRSPCIGNYKLSPCLSRQTKKESPLCDL